jgi:hypothetical protein
VSPFDFHLTSGQKGGQKNEGQKMGEERWIAKRVIAVAGIERVQFFWPHLLPSIFLPCGICPVIGRESLTYTPKGSLEMDQTSPFHFSEEKKVASRRVDANFERLRAYKLAPAPKSRPGHESTNNFLATPRFQRQTASLYMFAGSHRFMACRPKLPLLLRRRPLPGGASADAAHQYRTQSATDFFTTLARNLNLSNERT